MLNAHPEIIGLQEREPDHIFDLLIIPSKGDVALDSSIRS